MKKIYRSDDVVLKISYDRCTGSGECVQACPMSILKLEEGRAVCIDIDRCISCCACFNACPQEAIEHSMCSR